MRIHSVEVAGFGPFLEPQRVDFEAFAEHGIFLVQGRTGAGKSSILDAVVYALYNCAPRYGSRGAEHLRSHHCGPEDPTWVELEFSVDSSRFRLRRSPEYERPKARGEGLTTERATARLWRRDEDGWTALEASLRTVGQALHEILPLSHTQFLQVVMLAQGQFERFLVAESAERKKVLGALFDTRRFDDLDALLQERVAQARGRLERATAATQALLATLAGHLGVELPDEVAEEWLEEVRRRCADEAVAASTARDAAHAVLDTHRAELERLREVQSRQRRRAQLRASHDALLAERDGVEVCRQRLGRALAAQAVRPGREEAVRLAQRRTALAASVAEAEVAHEDLFGTAVPQALEAERDWLVAAAPGLERAAAAERRLQQDLVEVERRRTALGELEERGSRLTAEAARHEEVLARPVGTTTEVAERAVHELLAELARARRLEEARGATRQARVAAVAAGERRTRASAALDEVRRRSLEQSAGRLAESLVEGEPCQVCGSSVHPRPATLDGDPVGQDAVDDAQQAFDLAQEESLRSEAAWAAARAVEASLEGTVSLEEVTLRLQEATELHAAVVEEQRRRDEAERELARVQQQRQQAEVDLASQRAGLVALEESVAALRAEVAQARGDAPSVAERLAHLQRRLKVVDELLALRRDLVRVEDEWRAAERRLVQDLARHGFATVEESVAAELPDGEVAALERRVRTHEDAWTVTEAGLADPALSGLAEEDVDLTAATEAVRLAVEAHDRAAGAAGVAIQRHETATRLVEQVRAAWATHAEERRELDVLRRLAATVHGEPPNTRRLRLESYVLAVELEQIVMAANRRLAVMSGQRYELLLNDRVATRGNNAGLEVRVLDEHTQETRTPESLSGGEKFLASLSLALGLAEVVTERAGGITLDTLFIDEGFGSLDAETLDLAMHTLDQLREHGRTVGVISHVEAMKERIPAQLVVHRTPGGWSHVRTVV